MTIFLALLNLALFISLVILFLWSNRLRQQADQMRSQLASEVARIRKEADQAVTEAQKLIDQQVAEMGAEAERIRQHYESEARVMSEASQIQLAEALKKLRQAAKEEELKKKAKEESDRAIAAAKDAYERASAEEKIKLQKTITDMQLANENLRQDLAAATEKALTIAQQTKKGHVYVISNVGAFGENIYKIGQTRREPQIRVDELGDASVPFSFDIHALIESNNAPALEHKLQRRFLHTQVNKINSRKEFFRVTLKEIREEIDRLKEGEEFTVTHWSDLAEATQYREPRY